MTIYKHIQCKNALNKLNSRYLPYNYDLNIYRGCGHGCIYCFALYTHNYLESSSYYDEIYVKTNVLEALERELSSKFWKQDVINIGGVTDSYQPAEECYKLMPDVLKLMIKYKNPCIISTKSDLILRDFDLIDKLSRITYVNIACTITCVDQHITDVIEPGVVCSERRFKVLNAFSKTRASTGLHMMPIIPYLTDNTENLDNIFKNASNSSVSYILSCLVNLRGPTKKMFFRSIGTHYPDIYEKLDVLYRDKCCYKEYSRGFYDEISTLKKKYALISDYRSVMKKRLQYTQDNQLSLW